MMNAGRFPRSRSQNTGSRLTYGPISIPENQSQDVLMLIPESGNGVVFSAPAKINRVLVEEGQVS